MGKVINVLKFLVKLISNLFFGLVIFVFGYITMQNYLTTQDIKTDLKYYNSVLYLLTDYVKMIKADNIDNLKRDIAQVEAIKALATNMDELYKNHNEVVDAVNSIVTYIENAPQIDYVQKRMKELKLTQINVMIVNKAQGMLGSGETLKYNDRYYILSVAHLFKDENKDKLEMWENGEKICDLRIVKMDKALDLCLFASVDENIVPHYYTELAEEEPLPTEEIYVIGNPMGTEDYLSEGRIINYDKKFAWYFDHSYFGSSGGGIYNKNGQLVGTIDVMLALNSNGVVISQIPSFVIHGAVRLSVIKSFLEDIK
jgi:S1-C subfamily serine protease